MAEQSVLALLQNNVLTSTSDFETFHCFETREKKKKFLSGCLGYQKYWTPSCIFGGIRNSESPVLFGGSEFLNTFLCCLGDQKFWITCVVWGIRNSESPVLFGDQKFWILPCVVWGGQKFWISCVFWGSEFLNPLLCPWGIRNSESPVLLGGSEILNPLLCSWGIRNSESSPVLFGGSEILNLWVFACVPWRSKVRIFVRFLWGTSRDKKFRKSFSCLNLK